MLLPLNAIVAQPVEIGDNFKVITSKNNYFYYSIVEDSTGNIITNKAIDKNHLSLGIVNKKVAIDGALVNRSTKPIKAVLEIYNPTIDHGTVMFIQKGELIDSFAFGDRFKFKQRHYEHRNFVFPFELDANEEIQIFIEILPQLEAVYIPFRIVEEEYFLKKGTKEYLLLGGILGMYFVYIIFIVSLLIIAKRTLFLFYSIIDLFLLLYCIFDTGLGMQFIWCNSPIIQDIVVAIASFGYIVGLILFGRAFFSTRIKYPQLDKVLLGFIIFAGLTFLSIFIVYFVFGAPILIPLLGLNLVYVLFGLTISGLGIVTYLQAGRREGFWFLVLFFVQLLMWLLILNQRGYLGNPIISPDAGIYSFFNFKTATPHYIFLNMIIEVMIVSAIIAFRFQSNLDEYNVTRKKIEDINESSIKAFIKGQEVERTILAETLDQKLGRDLKIIKSELLKSKDNISNNEGIEVALHQLQDVENDLDEIASDFVIDWASVSLEHIVNKVLNQLKIGMTDISVDNSFNEILNNHNWNDLTKLNIYRILQEVCNNIIKHSQANQINVSFDEEEEKLNVTIEDNGIGFDFSEIELREGIGLRNIETRVKALKGKLNVEAVKEEGTMVKLQIPIDVNIEQ